MAKACFAVTSILYMFKLGLCNVFSMMITRGLYKFGGSISVVWWPHVVVDLSSYDRVRHSSAILARWAYDATRTYTPGKLTTKNHNTMCQCVKLSNMPKVAIYGPPSILWKLVSLLSYFGNRW